MINVNALPCADCMYCAGIKQPDGTQRSEYLSCKVAQNNKASALLKQQRGQIVCSKFRDLDDRMESTDWNAIANLCRMVGDKASIIRALDAWQETKHPRGKGGKFTKKGSGQSASTAESENEKPKSAETPKADTPKASTASTGAYRKQYPRSNPRMTKATKQLADAVKDKMKETDKKQFSEKIAQAKRQTDPRIQWRVDAHSPQDYESKGAVCFTSPKGSCVAVTKGHDIISVCSPAIKDVSGKQLMAWAVANGGDRLDSYDGNYGFYIKCGFEPVSACAFDPSYDIPGWDPAVNRQQPIVFMKYTGRSYEQIVNDYGGDGVSYLEKIPMFTDYDEAQKYRDKDMD